MPRALLSMFLCMILLPACSGSVDGDMCRDVVCEDPPADTCIDSNTLLVYEFTGSCNPDTGNCEYSFSERPCDHGCQNGRCMSQYPCQGVVCDHPPADACKDENTLVEYETSGTCNPDSGRCEYGFVETPCENGCESGRCKSGKDAGGWISVLELNGSWTDTRWDWEGGVRAFFAVEPHFSRSLSPWHNPLFLNEVASQGSCTLYAYTLRLGPIQTCDPPCQPDQICIKEGDQWICRDMPEHYNVGAITIEGLKADISMTADAYDRYLGEGLPDDLFDDGDAVTASASGGELEPFSLQATGVAHLEILSDTLDLARGQPATVSWMPADPGARILVSLLMGHHYPSPPSVALLCDVPDDDGQVVIPANLVDGFIDRALMYGHPSHVIRYTRDVITPFGQEIELIVGSVRNLQLTLP